MLSFFLEKLGLSSANPQRVIIAIAIALPLASLLFTRLNQFYQLRGYRQLRAELGKLLKFLEVPEINREDSDLLIHGLFQKTAVLIRFSRSERKPGLVLQTPFPYLLSLNCIHNENAEAAKASGTIVHTGDSLLDTRFQVRSDKPGMANFLVSGSRGSALLRQLCCSSRTFIVVADRRIEVRELVVPDQLASHIHSHLESVMQLTELARQLPGATSSKDAPRRMQYWRRYVPYAVSAGLIAAALLPGAGAQQESTKMVAIPAIDPAISPADARKIPDVQGWRLMQPDDFDSRGMAWLRQQGLQASAAITGGTQKDSDWASRLYLLARDTKSPKRAVILINGTLRYDTSVQQIALAAKVPQSAISGIDCTGSNPGNQATGDGFLLVRSYQDSGSSILLFPAGNQIVAAIPKDFHRISLQ